jgi:hypothetical protein
LYTDEQVALSKRSLVFPMTLNIVTRTKYSVAPSDTGDFGQ